MKLSSCPPASFPAFKPKALKALIKDHPDHTRPEGFLTIQYGLLTKEFCSDTKVIIEDCPRVGNLTDYYAFRSDDFWMDIGEESLFTHLTPFNADSENWYGSNPLINVLESFSSEDINAIEAIVSINDVNFPSCDKVEAIVYFVPKGALALWRTEP